jgi:signal peptidase I
MEGQWRSRIKELLRWTAFLGALLVVRASFADHYTVPSGSMEPSVMTGDRLVVSKAAYGLRVPLTTTYLARGDDPKRGDVVVLESPDTGEVLLKRVAAVPGDTVSVRGGRIATGGAVAPVERAGDRFIERLGGKSHDVRLTFGGGPDFGPVALGPDEYLVLGDNRGDSRDGRFFGFVERGAILGRAIGVYFRNGGFTWEEL